MNSTENKTDFNTLKNYIKGLDISSVSKERQEVLQPLIAYIKDKYEAKKAIRLNFICTHNSRRSHLSQVWAHVIANATGIKNVTCYSGGTEATAMFPKAAEALTKSGLAITALSSGNNPVYSIKFNTDEHPIIAFSKTYDNAFNPASEFAAIMTCNSADKGCPVILGAEKRIPVTYLDPKAFDNTPQQDEKYLERSNQIATEMKYVFSQVAK